MDYWKRTGEEIAVEEQIHRELTEQEYKHGDIVEEQKDGWCTFCVEL